MDFSFLNKKQQQIVEELDRNILLLASAGTGKTNTLSCRVANIIEQKRAKPEEIICLTFTNKACNEMKNRVMEVVGAEGQGVVVKTFHGFCYDILQWAAKRATDVSAGFTVFDEDDCQELIKELAWCGRGQERLLQALINLVKEYRGEYDIFTGQSARDYQQVMHRLMAEKQQRVMEAAKKKDELVMMMAQQAGQVVSAYDQQLLNNHGVDFHDLINHAFVLLKDKEIRSYWQASFKYWNVDEVQDTNQMEYAILTQLFGQSNLLLCGDFFQTIYQWRGSQPQLIYDSFGATYQPMRIVFHENYRSTRCLLDASYNYLKQRFPQQVAGLFKEDAEAKSAVQGELIQHKVCTKIYHEAYWIYTELQKLRPANLARVCILTRANYYNQKLSKYLQNICQHRYEQYNMGQLQEQDFPLEFMLVDEYKFFRRQEVKDVVAALRLLLHEQDNTSLLRLVKRFGHRIGPATLERIQSPEYRQAGIRLADFLHPSTRKYDEPFELLLRELEQGNVVVFDVEATGLNTGVDEIIQLAAIRIDIHGNELERMNVLLKATRPVGKSELVHGFSDARLQAEGLPPQEALQAFLDFARGRVVVGHNVNFDLTILSSQLTRLGMPQLDYLVYYDTLDIFRRFYPQLPNHKLEYLGEFCQVRHKSSHDAFDDICATGEILIYAVKQNIVPTIDQRRVLMKKHSRLFEPTAAALEELRCLARELRPGELIIRVIKRLGMDRHYANEPQRLENMRQLVRQARQLDDGSCSCYDALQNFLQLTSLSNTELDIMLQEKPKIPIITVHQAKGSEFDTVFLAGLQEGVFPSKFASDEDVLEEEARLFYVAITRAKERLYLSSAVSDSENTETVPSRFINGIPEEYISTDNR